MASGNNETREKTHGCLFTFIANIYNKTEFQYSKSETEAIIIGVQNLVENTIEILCDSKKFSARDIIHVGSSFDGSRVISSDEFDFMLVLKKWSQPGMVCLTRGCQDGKKTLRYANPDDIPIDQKANVILNNCMGLMLGQLFSGPQKSQKLDHLKCKILNGCINVRQYGNLTLYLDAFLKSDFEISVDIMPAVQLSWDLSEVKKDMKMSESPFKYLALQDKCLFVGKRCVDGTCWQLSFAETESKMIKNLAPGHMKIYRILKYLFDKKSIVGICDLITSYVLKTLILHHAYISCAEMSCACECLISILSDLSDKMERCYLGSIFIPSLNIWQNLVETKIRNITENQTICDATVRKDLLQILETDEVDFLKPAMVCVVFDFWKRIVRLLVQILDYFHIEDKSQVLEDILQIVYKKLNEEDEDDDMNADYFSAKTFSVKLEEEWNVDRSFLSPKKEDNQLTSNAIDMVNNDFSEQENEDLLQTIQEAKDIDDSTAELNDIFGNNIEDTENDDDDDDNDDDDDDEEEEEEEEVEEGFNTYGSDWFLQANITEIYFINDKYGKEITQLKIPLFSDLLEDVNKCLATNGCDFQFY